MAKAKFFNKGLLKGTVSKSEMVSYEGKGGKKGGSFLAMEVATGNSNRVKATIFPTKVNPNKATEIFEMFKVNSKVEVAGNVKETEFESKAGKKGIERSISGNAVKELADEKKTGATFLLQGTIEKVKEIEGGAEVKLFVDTSYDNKDGKKVEQSESFTLFADEEAVELMDDVEAVRGCNCKFKGKILNKVEFDDYGDVIGSIQMFKIDKVEDVVAKGDIEEEEDVSFL